LKNRQETDNLKDIGNSNVQQEEIEKAVLMTYYWLYFINYGQRESKSKFAQVNSKPTSAFEKKTDSNGKKKLSLNSGKKINL
jgi:hypothetical protein